jgi:hypothetical protein
MNTSVEVFCEVCFRETFHRPQAHDAAICLTCGTVRSLNGTRSFINEASKAKSGKRGNGEGGSSEGGSGRGEQPSEPTTAYATTAYAEMLHGEDLAALDSDREFARFVCEKAALTFRQDEPQEIVLGDDSGCAHLGR